MKTKSPLKYMGGKSYMLEAIYNIIPNYKTFVDVFGEDKIKVKLSLFEEQNYVKANIFNKYRPENG